MADISIKGLNQFFGENQILHDITFDIFPGEKVAIVGPNGAGKTTTLNGMISLFEKQGYQVMLAAPTG